MNKVRQGMTVPDVEKKLGQPSYRTTSGNTEIWAYVLGRVKGMLHTIRVAFTDARVSQVYIGIEALEDSDPQKPSSTQAASEPFMEHPSDQYENAIEAMEDAIRRLRALPKWDKWIEFSAQGENPARPGTIKFAEVRVLGDRLDVGDRALDLPVITAKAKVPATSIRADGKHYLIALTSPREFAVLLDAIFQQHFGIQPFADEGNDYSIGAEW
jgi:hypothetical protein